MKVSALTHHSRKASHIMIVAEEVEKERKREIKRKSREIYISLH